MLLLHHTWPSRLSTCGSHGTTAVSSLLRDSHRRCFCACMFVRFYEYQVCVRRVCAVTKSVYRSSTAAVQRQPCLKLLPLCQCHGVCVLVHSRRSHHDIFTSNAIINTYRRSSRQVHEAYSRSSSSSCISFERLCFPFSTCDAPGISSQPQPEGGTLYYE